MDTRDPVAWVLLFVPLVTGFVTGQASGSLSSAGQRVKSRPPGWVFATVWTVLYLLLGFAWAVTYKEGALVNVFIGILVVALIMWIVTYNAIGDKKAALYVLVISLLMAVLTWSYMLRESKKTWTNYLIVPLVIWLVFATLLNFEEVNRS